METNAIFIRHQLSARKQQSEENLKLYMQNFKTLCRNGKFKALTVEQTRGVFIRNTFINKILSKLISFKL